MRFRLRECGWPEFIDVRYLASRLAGNRRLRACYLCVGRPHSGHLSQGQYWNETRYYRRVEWQELVQVDYGYMVNRGTRWVEKKVDVLLAAKMVSMACTHGFDTAILVSADGDLVPAVESVIELGKKVETVVFTKSRAYD